MGGFVGECDNITSPQYFYPLRSPESIYTEAPHPPPHGGRPGGDEPTTAAPAPDHHAPRHQPAINRSSALGIFLHHPLAFRAIMTHHYIVHFGQPAVAGTLSGAYHHEHEREKVEKNR